MKFAHCVRLGIDFEPEDLVDWYNAASGNDIAVIITIAARASDVQIRRCPRNCIFWLPEGGRGVTEPLEKAVRRLKMLREPSSH